MRLTGVFALVVTSVLWTASPADASPSLVEHCNTNVRYLQAATPVTFAASSATLTRPSENLIDTLALIAIDCPNSRIIIEGHTDSRGSDVLNDALSLARAQAIARALADRGISESRTRAFGLGSRRPIADNSDRDGRAKNRRIEIRFEAS